MDANTDVVVDADVMPMQTCINLLMWILTWILTGIQMQTWMKMRFQSRLHASDVAHTNMATVAYVFVVADT